MGVSTLKHLLFYCRVCTQNSTANAHLQPIHHFLMTIAAFSCLVVGGLAIQMTGWLLVVSHALTAAAV